MISLLDKVAEHCIGLQLEDAKKKIEKAGAICRITEIDGRGLMVSADFNSNRVNLDLHKNKVKRARVG